MTELERLINEIEIARNFIKGFCAVCSKRKTICEKGCEYGTILKALDYMEKAENENKT